MRYESGFRVFGSLLLAAVLAGSGRVEPVIVPLGGNGYFTVTGPGDQLGGRGGMRWRSAEGVVSIYFRVDRPTELDLGLKGIRVDGSSQIRVSVGERDFTVELKEGGPSDVAIGRVNVERAGHVRVDLKGIRKSGDGFGSFDGLTVVPAVADATLNFVRNNEENRFYWGRRGPSVHLGYRLPLERPVEWFYSEVTVPRGEDPVGSYFMANGFREGYFGFQVNSPSERRILFSVWSPFSTDDPKAIPADQRIDVLAKGEAVRTGEFGNEGSGGQSFLVYPWKAGVTYRFLNRAKPDGQGNTIYSAWFSSADDGQWRLMATFRRPKTDTHLTGIHSFLENFSDRQGWVGRKALYGNQWARDTDGKWHRLTEARFTGDDIAQRGFRLDFAGGVQGEAFYLRNGGFFDDGVGLGRVLTRPAGAASPPVIRFEALEGFESGTSLSGG